MKKKKLKKVIKELKGDIMDLRRLLTDLNYYNRHNL